MYNFIQKHLDIKLLKTCLVFALIYWLLFNSVIAAYKFDQSEIPLFNLIISLLKDFCYIYFALVIIFFALSTHRILFLIGSLFLFITGAIASFYLFFFQLAPTPAELSLLYSTDFSEILHELDIRLIVWIIFSISICLYSYKYFDIQTTDLFVNKILSAFCLILFINNIIHPYLNVLSEYFPIQYLHNSYNYLT